MIYISDIRSVETLCYWLFLPPACKGCGKVIGFFTIGLSDAFSVRLSDRSEVTQHKINFIKNCPQWGLNSQPPDHQSCALPTVLARNLLEICEVSFSFVSCTTSHVELCLFLESIEHDFIKALVIHRDNQIVT